MDVKRSKNDVERLLRDTIPRVSALELRPSGSWWVLDVRYGMAMTLFVTAPSLEALDALVEGYLHG